ncbi:MAG: EVE domain-containing protein [Ferruginibacter sp.]
MTKYFLICATRDHVSKGVAAGFAQAGHGRKDLMSKPAKGDWIACYSSRDKIDKGEVLQKFTAIGRIKDEEPYKPNNDSNFKPYRRDVKYLKCREADIRPLINDLSFIKNKKSWGFYLIGGFREISTEDFKLIKTAMK